MAPGRLVTGMRLDAVADRLDELLALDAYRDLDASINGLQVGAADAAVDRVGLAVDAALGPIEAAGAAGVDLLVVHHGLLWGALEPITGVLYGRLRALLEHDVALYAAHLPLDGHERLGNGALLADALDLVDRAPLAGAGEPPVGAIASFADSTDLETLVVALAEVLETDVAAIDRIGEPVDSVERVAIVTGSGTGYLDAAVAAGADVVVTGEGKHSAVHLARELGVEVVLAGHYATETFGVRALAEPLEAWGLETAFFDDPTGL